MHKLKHIWRSDNPFWDRDFGSGGGTKTSDMMPMREYVELELQEWLFTLVSNVILGKAGGVVRNFGLRCLMRERCGMWG